MKIVCTLMLMLALGLSTAFGQQEWAENTNDIDDVIDESGSPYGLDDFLSHLLKNAENDDDDDDDDNDDDDVDDNDDFEIVDMDDALQKYRMLKSIARIVEEAESQTPNKRFIGGIFKKIKDTVEKAASKVGDFFKNVFSKAKDAFVKITKAIPFEKAVDKLLPLLHSGMSKAACKKALQAGAKAILGPAAIVVGQVGGPVCDAALAKIAEMAG